MATVVTNAVPATADGYTASTSVYTGQSVAIAAVPTDPGVVNDTPAYAKPVPRLDIAYSPQAARWLFPTVTAVPAVPAFTRYPVGP